jgi:hypothetical protein
MKLIDYILVSLVVLITMIIYDNMKNSGKRPIEHFLNADEKASIINAANILQNINAGQSITLKDLTITGNLKIGDFQISQHGTNPKNLAIAGPNSSAWHFWGDKDVKTHFRGSISHNGAGTFSSVKSNGTIEATGNGKFATVEASGNGKFATVEASGNGKFGSVEASGNGKFATVEASGNGKFGSVEATGNGNLKIGDFQISQHGTNPKNLAIAGPNSSAWHFWGDKDVKTHFRGSISHNGAGTFNSVKSNGTIEATGNGKFGSVDTGVGKFSRINIGEFRIIQENYPNATYPNLAIRGPHTKKWHFRSDWSSGSVAS